jgi:hypothetical protein
MMDPHVKQRTGMIIEPLFAPGFTLGLKKLSLRHFVRNTPALPLNHPDQMLKVTIFASCLVSIAFWQHMV